MKLLLPPDPQPIPDKASLIFLAGPIQGAPDWQGEAIDMIQAEAPELWIASPRRSYLNRDFDYSSQVNWEIAHIRRALNRGVVMFWLAAEETHHPDRAYAQTTRFELAESKVHHEVNGGKVVIGIEDGFSGAKYVRQRFGTDCPDVPILTSLEETCRAAIDLAGTQV